LDEEANAENLTEEQRQPKPGKGAVESKAIKGFSAA
jgi:hypothetical protein